MIVIDSSALIAMLQDEPERVKFASMCLEPRESPLTPALSPWERESARSRCSGVPSPMGRGTG